MLRYLEISNSTIPALVQYGPSVVSNISSCPPPAHETTTSLELVKDRLDPSSHILFLQNGMGMYEDTCYNTSGSPANPKIGATDEVSRGSLFPDPKTQPTYWVGVSYDGIYSKSPFSFTQPGRFQLQLGPILSSQTQVSKEEQITQSNNYLMRQILSINFPDFRVHLALQASSERNNYASSSSTPLSTLSRSSSTARTETSRKLIVTRTASSL